MEYKASELFTAEDKEKALEAIKVFNGREIKIIDKSNFQKKVEK